MTYTIDGVAYGIVGRTERCPHCGEYLWEEWGYWSYEEMLLWDYFYYVVIDFPVDHHRWVD